MSAPTLLGMDLGGTNVRMRLCLLDGTVIGDHRAKLEGRKDKEVSAFLIEETSTFCQQHQIEGPLWLSMAVAAMLDPTGTLVQNAPNLKWRHFPLAKALQEIPGVQKVSLINDVDAAALGEYVAGAGQGAASLACVLAGSGVGAGLVFDGKPYSGSSRVAAEFGHMKFVAEGGLLCGCGAHGCIEAYAGGHNLTRMAQEEATTHPEGFLGQRAKEKGADKLSPADIEAGAVAGDEVCLALTHRAAKALGIGLANLITLLNPSHLLLGGGAMLHSPHFHQETLKVVSQLTNAPAYEAVQILPPQLGDLAGLVGAVERARQMGSLS